MEREETAMIGFEIITYAGIAKTKLFEALKKARIGVFEGIEELVNEANDNIIKAHQVQTDLIKKEAQNEKVDIGTILVHAQDHLMTTLLLYDIIQDLINVYKFEFKEKNK